MEPFLRAAAEADGAGAVSEGAGGEEVETVGDPPRERQRWEREKACGGLKKHWGQELFFPRQR